MSESIMVYSNGVLVAGKPLEYCSGNLEAKNGNTTETIVTDKDVKITYEYVGEKK